MDPQRRQTCNPVRSASTGAGERPRFSNAQAVSAYTVPTAAMGLRLQARRVDEPCHHAQLDPIPPFFLVSPFYNREDQSLTLKSESCALAICSPFTSRSLLAQLLAIPERRPPRRAFTQCLPICKESQAHGEWLSGIIESPNGWCDAPDHDGRRRWASSRNAKAPSRTAASVTWEGSTSCLPCPPCTCL